MKAEISNGDLLDKMSILEIKLNKFDEGSKKMNVERELTMLIDSAVGSSLDQWLLSDDYKALLEVNIALWDIEDKIREKEAAQQFDEDFIGLARSVYLVNDERAAIKKKINEETLSLLVEEKQYVNYIDWENSTPPGGKSGFPELDKLMEAEADESTD